MYDRYGNWLKSGNTSFTWGVTFIVLVWAVFLVISWFIMPFKVIFDLIMFKKRKELTKERLRAIIIYLVSYVILYGTLVAFALLKSHGLEVNDHVTVIGMVSIESLQIVFALVYSKVVWDSYAPFKWMRRKRIDKYQLNDDQQDF